MKSVILFSQNQELLAENAELPGLKDTVEELRYLESKVVGVVIKRDCIT